MRGSYPSAEILLVYSTVSAYWAILSRGILGFIKRSKKDLWIIGGPLYLKSDYFNFILFVYVFIYFFLHEGEYEKIEIG